jgi:hypothetical protein
MMRPDPCPKADEPIARIRAAPRKTDGTNDVPDLDWIRICLRRDGG